MLTTKAIRPSPHPKSISHYTNIDGVMGIVASRCLRASNASFLNDRSELLHALGAAKKAIQKLSSTRALADWSPLLEKVVKELQEGAIPETYVVCFCRDSDNLSQWRGYGGGEQGVSLTFDRAKLALRLKGDHAKFYRVTYAKITTASKLRDALKGELAAIAELDEILGQTSDKEKYADLFSRVSGLLPKFKHLGFRDEREWRFVIQRKCEPSEIFFRPSGNKIAPYIEVGKSNKPLPITSVTVGPGRDQALTAQSLQTFLAARGYGTVPIGISDVPFRQ